MANKSAPNSFNEKNRSPEPITKETRLQAALEGKLPEYINTLVANCLETGNAYGKEIQQDNKDKDCFLQTKTNEGTR